MKKFKIHVVVEEYTSGYVILEAATDDDLQELLDDEDAWIDDVQWDDSHDGGIEVAEIEELPDDL